MVGDRPTWQLEFTPTDGQPVLRHFDTENGLLIMSILKNLGPEKNRNYEFRFSPRNQDDIPVLKKCVMRDMSFRGMTTVTEFTEVRINPQLENELFVIPK